MIIFIQSTLSELKDKSSADIKGSDIEQSDYYTDDADDEHSDIEGMSYYICIMLSIYHNKTTSLVKFLV